jgi:hypothetical protein
MDVAGPEVGPYSAAISDGAHGAVEGPQGFFYFLPPMVPDPGTLGEFNAHLLPVVQICIGNGTGECDELTSFTTLTGPGSETVRVDETAGHYIVNWHTDATGTTAGSYQIRVLLSGIVMGWADVEVVENGKALKNLRTQDVIGLKDGRTLPIKFFIDERAFCDPDAEECVTESISAADGGQVSLGSDDNVLFPSQPDDVFEVYTEDGSGTEFVSSIDATISDCGPDDELNLDLPTFGACFKVTTDRELVPIEEEEYRPTVSVCSIELPDVSGLLLQQIEQITIHQGDLVDGEMQVQALQHKAENCPDPPPWEASSGDNGLFRLAKVGWNALRSLIGPEPLNAAPPRMMFFHDDRGSKPIEFSSFQAALPAQMAPVSELERTGVEGDVLTTLIQAVDWYEGEEEEGVANATLRFEVLGGGSIAGDAVRTTDVDGFVEVDWTLGPGPNELQVTGRGLAGLEDDGPFTPFTGIGNPQLPDVPVVLDREVVFLAVPPVIDRSSLSCSWSPGGDEISRGFYIPDYPGAALDRVDLFFSARVAGDYTIRLTVREEAYDGPLVGTSETTVALSAVDTDNRMGTFLFPSPSVTPGALLTFAMELVSGPGVQVFFAISNDTDCASVETEGTTPPLSQDRFGGRGVGMNIFGPPDLIVSWIDPATTQVNPGQSLPHTFEVSNIGGDAPDLPGISVWDVATYLSTDDVWDASDRLLSGGYSAWSYPLSEGWSATRSQSVVIPVDVEAGTYYVIVVADAWPGQPPNFYPGVVESNEANNELAFAITVQ